MCTPPNHPPPAKEQVKHRHWSEPYVNVLLAWGGLALTKVVFWLAGLAEIAVILANQYPSCPASSIVLEHLLFPAASKHADDICLTLPAVIGSILVTTGGIIRGWCYRSLNRLFTFQLSIRPYHSLVTTGPYAFVRHPSYSAALVGFWGSHLVLFGHGGWVRESGVLSTAVGKVGVALWIFIFGFVMHAGCFYRVETEDKLLRDTFGKEWESWAKRVQWKLIPGVV